MRIGGRHRIASGSRTSRTTPEFAGEMAAEATLTAADIANAGAGYPRTGQSVHSLCQSVQKSALMRQSAIDEIELEGNMLVVNRAAKFGHRA
jgi:hypothetical protein